MQKTLNIFVRQPFTGTSETEQKLVSDALCVIKGLGRKYSSIFLTGEKALNKENFISEWEKVTNEKFTPSRFRNYRIALLDKADLFINIRTGMSESSAFEIAYNVYHKKVPMFFAVWDQAPIKTTLLRDLQDICYVEYHPFSEPEQLYLPLSSFIEKIVEEKIIHLQSTT